MHKSQCAMRILDKIKLVIIMDINRLKEIMEDRDYKQIDIAKILKVTQAQYCRYEMGINSIPVEKLVVLAKFYNTSVDYLLGLTDERKKYPESILNK